MPDLVFPTIIGASIASTASVADNSLKSEFVNGMQVTRPRYSRQLKSFELSWNAMSASQLGTLKAFYERTFGGAVSFVWQDFNNQNLTVRFNSDLTYNCVGGSGSNALFAVKVMLKEV